MNARLPDPRQYGKGNHSLLDLSDAELRAALRDALGDARDAEIFAALRAAPSRAEYVRVWNAVCDAAHRASARTDPTAVATQIFALPLVIVTGAQRRTVISGVLSDVAVVTQTLRESGALGPLENVSFGNALVALDTLESLQPHEVYAWTGPSGTRSDLPPADLAIQEPGEFVHLRFLVGAAIAPAAEPSVVETASRIDAWGMAMTRALGGQLGASGVEVLALPRPPVDLLRAAHAGRVAQLEAAFNLFMSNAVRRFRSSIGDPYAIVSAHDDAEIRMTLNSAFDDAAVDGFRWPLNPLDDIDGVVAAVTELLQECRVSDVRFAAAVLPALDAQGRTWFPRAPEASEMPSRH